MSAFRLSLAYTRVLTEDGDAGLASPDMKTNAVSIDMAFPSNNYVRNTSGWGTSGSRWARIRRAASASI